MQNPPRIRPRRHGGLHLLPQPKSVTPRAGHFPVPSVGTLGIGDGSLHPVATELRTFWPNLTVHASLPGHADTVTVTLCTERGRDAYRLAIDASGVHIAAGAVPGAWYAVQTLRQLVSQAPAAGLPALVIEDWPDFADRGLYYDVTRGRVPTLASLLRLADQLGRYKINQLQLYIEHTFCFRGHPDIGEGASPLTPEDILTLDAHCRARHIELVPSLASFGHLATVLNHPRYHALAEDWGVGKYVAQDAPPAWLRRAWSLAPANPDVYAFLDSLFAEFLPLFSSTRFNACCDETYDLGWGQSHALCRQRGKGRVYLDHIVKVRDLARKYGKSLMFWGDIIRHYPELVGDIPKDVTVLDWGYSHEHRFEAIRDFKQAGLTCYACPGTASWLGLFARLPQARANIAGFAAAAKTHGAQGLLNTDWGDGGHSNFMEYSWHGYLFGAEQAWNTDAAQADFTERFVACFLGHADSALAAALEELGDITCTCPPGGGASVWLDLFFALPDEAIFKQPQPVAGTFVRHGRLVTKRRRFDAAFAHSLLSRLAAIRAVFADRVGRPGLDPTGVLPYWIFAVDATTIAVRKLAAFGPGAHPDPAERAAITRGLRELRRRFERLWRARNRPSEIGITLARYDRVIRGDCVRTTLAEAGPGHIRVTVTNTGVRAASGRLRLRVQPEPAATLAPATDMVFRHLRPGASRYAEFALAVAGAPGSFAVTATGTGAGVHGASLTIFPERRWTLPRLAQLPATPEALRDLLTATAPVRPVQRAGDTVAEVRAALTAEAIALVATVRDATITRGAPVWSGSCVEVFGCATEAPNAAIGQVFLAPPTAAAPVAAFKLKTKIVPTPEIHLAAMAVSATGYTLVARVPLSLLRIPAGARAFRLEVVVTARPADQSEHRRAALFFAVHDASTNPAGFGFIQTQKEPS